MDLEMVLDQDLRVDQDHALDHALDQDQILEEEDQEVIQIQKGNFQIIILDLNKL